MPPRASLRGHHGRDAATTRRPSTFRRPTFAMKANLPQNEPKRLEQWREIDLYGCIREKSAGPAEVRPARRPAVRERPHPHRPRPQQDPQGHRREVADDARLRLAVRPGLGLPRPADRARRRQGARLEEEGDVAPPTSAAPAASSPRSTSTSSARTSSASASSATGSIRT